MYIDKDDFTAWMERIMDRFDMQDKKIDRVINGRNCCLLYTSPSPRDRG